MGRGCAGSLLVEDRQLLRAFRRGDTVALERVYRAYAPHVARYLARTFASLARGPQGAAADLESAHQETFLRAFAPRARQAYDGQRPYEAYLNSVARSAAVDGLRSSGESSRQARALEGSELPDWEPQESMTPERHVLAEEARALVRRFLDALDEDERSFADARFVEGLSQERAAAALGLSRQEARTRETRLRLRLRAFLSVQGWFDTGGAG